MTATGVGALRWVPGPVAGQQAAFVEEGTTNLLGNPSLETNTGFASPWTSATISRDTAYAYSGAASLKVVTPGASALEGASMQTATLTLTGTARVYSGAVYLRGSGTVRVWLRINYSDGTITDNLGANYLDVVLTSEWQRVAPPRITSDPAKTITIVVILFRTTTIQATTYWADAAQIEEKGYATSYADGSLGPGYTWAGTAHASASTRAATTLNLADTAGRINTVTGEMWILFRLPLGPAFSTENYLWSVGTYSAANDFLAVLQSQSGASLRAIFRTNSLAAGTTLSVAFTRGAWTLVRLSWTATDIVLQVDGQSVTAARTVAPLGTLSSGFQWGQWGILHANAEIGPSFVFDRPLTDAERARLTAAMQAGTAGWATLIPQLPGILRTPGSEPIGVMRIGGAS